MQTNPESASVEAVARYGLDVLRDRGAVIPFATPDADGCFVMYEDHQSALDALRGEVERLVKALDEAACELSAAGQALAEFEGFEFRQKAAIDRAYAASQKAHDANGYTEALTKVTP